MLEAVLFHLSSTLNHFWNVEGHKMCRQRLNVPKANLWGKWKVFHEINMQQIPTFVRVITNPYFQSHHAWKAEIIYLPAKEGTWGSTSLWALLRSSGKKKLHRALLKELCSWRVPRKLFEFQKRYAEKEWKWIERHFSLKNMHPY